MKGAEEAGAVYADCIVFEDSAAGIQAAHSAGMKAIGIGTKENLPDADFIMQGFDGVNLQDILEIEK